MADRAQYLARTLLTRIAGLQEDAPETISSNTSRPQRLAVVEKVLVVELGITDGATLSLVESAVPHFSLRKGFTDRDVNAFADFLRQQLSRALAEP